MELKVSTESCKHGSSVKHPTAIKNTGGRHYRIAAEFIPAARTEPLLGHMMALTPQLGLNHVEDTWRHQPQQSHYVQQALSPTPTQLLTSHWHTYNNTNTTPTGKYNKCDNYCSTDNPNSVPSTWEKKEHLQYIQSRLEGFNNNNRISCFML